MLPEKIISGGQTGADRGALEAALALGIPHGGWCPRGRLAEDGRIPRRYRLTETDSPDYPFRTECNVLDSDATLIVYRGELGGGTLLTFRLATEHGRPCLAIDLDSPPPREEVQAWLREHEVRVLNVAGPRESQSSGIEEASCDLLVKLLDAAAE
jgi:hypothetical protein